MAERNTGPVKPPVLDLSARDTTQRPEEAPKPETKPDTKSEAKPEARPASKPEAGSKPGAPAAESGFHWAPALTGIIGGAILGTAITYGLLAWGVVPQPTPQTDPRIAALEKRLADASESSQATINTLTQRFSTLQNDFNARLEAANEAVAALKAQAPATVPDLTDFKAQLDALNARVESLGSGAGEAADTALSGDVEAMRQGLADLSGKLGTLEDKVGTADSKIAELSAEAQKAPELPAVQLPLLLSSLESAFDSGRPFATELEGLKAIVPGAVVPTSLSERAAQGLTRPDEVTRQFEAVLPDMLAATPGKPDADWTEAGLDWLKSMLAFRPAGEISGTTPEAIASQLEAAVARRDYGAATALLSALPEPMRAPAATVSVEIAAHADADALLQSLRAQALAPAGTTP